MIHVSEKDGKPGANSSSTSAVDLIDFSKDIFSTNRTIIPPNVTSSKSDQVVRENKYEAIEAFPASNQYELELQKGDVVIMIKQRRDGWCKGIHDRSGKTGLFPSSFVRKL